MRNRGTVNMGNRGTVNMGNRGTVDMGNRDMGNRMHRRNKKIETKKT